MKHCLFCGSCAGVGSIIGMIIFIVALWASLRWDDWRRKRRDRKMLNRAVARGLQKRKEWKRRMGPPPEKPSTDIPKAPPKNRPCPPPPPPPPPPKKWLHLVLFASLAWQASACSYHTARFSDVVDGKGGQWTSYESHLIVPPFGRLDSQAARMGYEWSKSGSGRIMVGQATAGANNEKQADVAKASIFGAVKLAMAALGAPLP